MNVLSLFAGSIPLIAIQLSALEVGAHVVLNFVRVLDQVELRSDDEEESQQARTDRAYWEGRTPADILALMDELLGTVNAASRTKQSLNYTKHHIGLTDGFRSRNFIKFTPRKRHLRIGVEVPNREEWSEKLQEADLDAIAKPRKVWVNLNPREMEPNEALIRELLEASVKHFEGE